MVRGEAMSKWLDDWRERLQAVQHGTPEGAVDFIRYMNMMEVVDYTLRNAVTQEELMKCALILTGARISEVNALWERAQREAEHSIYETPLGRFRKILIERAR